MFSAEAETSNDLQDALTGGASGARMGVIMQYLVTSGDVAFGTAEGTILCNLRDGDPLPTIGETITGVGDNASVQFNVVSVQSAEADGPFSRGANTTEATATFAPLSGSPAIGTVNTDEPYAIDDINGVLRGVNGSIGASD